MYLMDTTVRCLVPKKGLLPLRSTYGLPAQEAVAVAYAAWKCGGHRTGMRDFEASLIEGRALAKPDAKPGVFRIILPDGRAWYGIPE